METKNFTGSSALVKGAYDAGTQLMRLWFTSDPQAGYDYRGVPRSVWDGLVRANSAGKYFSDNIRGKYDDPFHGNVWGGRR